MSRGLESCPVIHREHNYSSTQSFSAHKDAKSNFRMDLLDRAVSYNVLDCGDEHVPWICIMNISDS